MTSDRTGPVPRPLPSSRGRASPALTAAVLAVVAAAVPAQRQFDELRKRGLPTATGYTLSVALGDVDGDGDLDAVLGNGGQNGLYLNDGRGHYTDATAARMPADADDTSAVALGDVDGDGDLDIVFGNAGYPAAQQNRLYLNDGTGTYTDATATRMPADSDYTNAVALGDVDGDGDLDLVLGNGGQNRLYLNDGLGTYTDATTARMPVDSDQTRAVALGDVDGDADLDIIFANEFPPICCGFQPNRIYLNDGTGTYTDATAARGPIGGHSAAVALGDVDGDGDLDIVFGNRPDRYAPSGQNRLYLNDGRGHYTDATAAQMPADNDYTVAVALGDVDGDGDLDIVFGGQNRLYLNDGTGTYTDATAARLPSGGSSSVALGDVDGDGDLDIVFGGQNRLYLNDGRGHYTDATAGRIPVGITPVLALGDVDGDGDLDIVFGYEQNGLYVNDGRGHYIDVTAARIPPGGGSSALALGDVDGDGDLDIVFTNWGQNWLYLNDGTGTYTDATSTLMPPDSDYTSAVALGDVDGDGDLDMVLGNAPVGNSGQNRLYLNDGTGTYTDATAARLPIDTDRPGAVALDDVDGDGDLDIVFGNASQRNRLYLNDGTGTYTDATAARLPVDSDATSTVALGDVDGDGDLDMLFGNTPFGNSGQNRLYLNDGRGHYTDATAARLPADNHYTRALALGDVDGDGDLDMVSGNSGPHSNTLYLNDGRGYYTDVTAARMPVDGGALSVALRDVDGDGDLDVVFGNGGIQSRLYLNLARQLDAPFLLRIGQTYTLEAYARYGLPSVVDIALPYIATGTASIPLPSLGTLGLDPTLMLPLPAFVIPQPAGVGSVAFTVPNVPTLVGTAVYAQAMLLSYPSQARLTNVTVDVAIQ